MVSITALWVLLSQTGRRSLFDWPEGVWMEMASETMRIIWDDLGDCMSGRRVEIWDENFLALQMHVMPVCVCALCSFAELQSSALNEC